MSIISPNYNMCIDKTPNVSKNKRGFSAREFKPASNKLYCSPKLTSGMIDPHNSRLEGTLELRILYSSIFGNALLLGVILGGVT